MNYWKHLKQTLKGKEMSKMIKLTFEISDDYKLKSIVFDYNDTGLPNSSHTLKNLATAILVAVSENKKSLIIQDFNNVILNNTKP